MNYIVAREREPFQKLGDYNYCTLEEMILPDILAFDTETTGLQAIHHDLFCCQIGTGKNNYLVVMYNNNYKFEEVIPYLEGKILIGHNILFDLGFVYKYNFFPKEVRDTMLASKIIYNGDEEVYRHDFGAVMYRELDVKYDKTEQKNISEVKLSVPTAITYCFNDVDRLIELHDKLYEKILDGDFINTYALHCRYIRVLAYIEQCGLPIEPTLWKKKMEQDIINTSTWRTKIEAYIYEHIPKYRDHQLNLWDTEQRITLSITSPLQMLAVFAEFKIPTKDKDGKDSIKEDILIKTKHEFVDMWLKFQEANHRVTTFGDKVYQQIDNDRIYTHFNPMVDTARLSVRKGNINFLNFPRDSETRDCFVANKGNRMVVCDLGGQENVLSADFTKDPAMVAAVTEGRDLHCMLTRVLHPDLAEMSDEEIMNNHSKERQDSKPIRFAFAYGGNAFTIHQNGNIPYDEAVEIEKKYKELHAGIYAWGERVLNNSLRTGYIESVDGWKLKLPGFDDFKALRKTVKSFDEYQWTMYKEGKKEQAKIKTALDKKEVYVPLNKAPLEFYKKYKPTMSKFYRQKSEYSRLCLNSPIQTAGAHQIKLAGCLLFDWMLENNLIWKVKICNSIYDELVTECEESLAELLRENLERCMIEGANHYLADLKCPADAHIGPSWGEAKKPKKVKKEEEDDEENTKEQIARILGSEE